MNADLLDTPASSPAAADPIPLAPIVRLLLTPSEAAAALRISPRLLWSKTKLGEIPCVRIGKAVRYSAAALQEWIDRVSGST
jgi:excisionase family DNA binding protein